MYFLVHAPEIVPPPMFEMGKLPATFIYNLKYSGRKRILLEFGLCLMF